MPASELQLQVSEVAVDFEEGELGIFEKFDVDRIPLCKLLVHFLHDLVFVLVLALEQEDEVLHLHLELGG